MERLPPPPPPPEPIVFSANAPKPPKFPLKYVPDKVNGLPRGQKMSPNRGKPAPQELSNANSYCNKPRVCSQVAEIVRPGSSMFSDVCLFLMT